MLWSCIRCLADALESGPIKDKYYTYQRIKYECYLLPEEDGLLNILQRVCFIWLLTDDIKETHISGKYGKNKHD